jgi:hypothetical protein
LASSGQPPVSSGALFPGWLRGAFDIQAFYSKSKNQVTLWAVLKGAGSHACGSRRVARL